jgi:hypothetical protein
LPTCQNHEETEIRGILAPRLVSAAANRTV